MTYNIYMKKLLILFLSVNLKATFDLFSRTNIKVQTQTFKTIDNEFYSDMFNALDMLFDSYNIDLNEIDVNPTNIENKFNCETWHSRQISGIYHSLSRMKNMKYELCDQVLNSLKIGNIKEAKSILLPTIGIEISEMKDILFRSYNFNDKSTINSFYSHFTEFLNKASSCNYNQVLASELVRKPFDRSLLIVDALEMTGIEAVDTQTKRNNAKSKSRRDELHQFIEEQDKKTENINIYGGDDRDKGINIFDIFNPNFNPNDHDPIPVNCISEVLSFILYGNKNIAYTINLITSTIKIDERNKFTCISSLLEDNKLLNEIKLLMSFRHINFISDKFDIQYFNDCINVTRFMANIDSEFRYTPIGNRDFGLLSMTLENLQYFEELLGQPKTDSLSSIMNKFSNEYINLPNYDNFILDLLNNHDDVSAYFALHEIKALYKKVENLIKENHKQALEESANNIKKLEKLIEEKTNNIKKLEKLNNLQNP